MLKQIIGKFRTSQVDPNLDSSLRETDGSDSGLTPLQQGLPPDADEVLAIATEVKQTAIAMLVDRKVLVSTLELRRRLSKRQFRAYITISSRVGIDDLCAMEDELRRTVNRLHRIEIADFFWRFRSAVDLAVV